jgi:hypothetical protein
MATDTATRQIRTLAYYMRKMDEGERKCRTRGRHTWPTENLAGATTLPPDIHVTGQYWEGQHRLRVSEYCADCGSEGISFRHSDGFRNYQIARRVVHGPDWTTIPNQVDAYPRDLKAAGEGKATAALFVKAAKTTE